MSLALIHQGGFGGAEHVSSEALELLTKRCRRVYFGVRGRNVLGMTPSLLLRDVISPAWPLALSEQVILGSLDDPATAERGRLAQWCETLPASRQSTAEQVHVFIAQR